MFSVACKQRGNLHLVMVDGDIDIATAPRLREQFKRCIDEGALVVIVDLSFVAFCDAQGVNLLVTVHKRLIALGRELRVVIPKARMLYKVLQICGLIGTILVYDDVSEALAA